MSRASWEKRRANEAALRAASRDGARLALESVQRRNAAKESRQSGQSPSAAPEPRNSTPMPAQRPYAGPSASPELSRNQELADYRRAVFGSAMDASAPSEPFAPVVTPPAPPSFRKQVFEYEGIYYEDRELKKPTDDVESYVCSRGLCYRTKLHRISVELIIVPSYPRNTIGIEYEVGEPKDGVAMWVPKNGLRIPSHSLGFNPSR